MKRYFSLISVILFIVSALPAAAADDLNMSKQWVAYSIDVKLNPDQNTLTGQEQVTWTNYSKDTVKEIYFHLYPNAFRSSESTFNRESNGQLRGDRATKDSIGRMDVTEIQINGKSFMDSFEFAQPDDKNKDDFTVAKLTLDQPVAPGNSVAVDIDFNVALPKVYARMGYWDNFVMGAQWFPKIAVYEPKGWRYREQSGWNAHQYHGNSEFYANFGTFDVNVTVPKSYVVAATGERTSENTNEDGTKTVHHHAENVHDFVWSASPDFVTFEKKISVAGNDNVTVKLYLQPQHEDLKDRYFDVATKSLQRFSDWYTPYPYSVLSVVEPAAGAGGAAGMEYPTLVTAWDAGKPDVGTEGLETVVAHEIGHQFFYGLLASNEFEEAWLDEGFTTYAETQLMIHEYNKDPKSVLADRSAMTLPESLVKPAWDYQEYGNNVYTRANLVLTAIQTRIGDVKMAEVMHTYAEQWKFKHPTTKDFQNVVESVTGEQWDTFFDQFVYGDEMVDVAVNAIKTITGKKCYCYDVELESRSLLHEPVEMKLVFEGGSEKVETWTPHSQKETMEVSNDIRLDYVVLDPDNKLILENRYINNRLKVKSDILSTINSNAFVSGLLQWLYSWFGW